MSEQCDIAIEQGHRIPLHLTAGDLGYQREWRSLPLDYQIPLSMHDVFVSLMIYFIHSLNLYNNN